MKDLPHKEFYEIFIMKKYIRKFVRLNSKNSEEQIREAHTNAKPKLPEGFEFLPVKRSIVIKKEKENKEKYMHLLLEADPSKDMINDYLRDGELFVLTYKEKIACVAVVKKIDNETIELKNIVSKEEYRGQGYGKKMLKYLTDNYKQKYKKMIARNIRE